MVPSNADLRRASQSLREVASITGGLPEDPPTDAILRDGTR
jgi:hypothetical protein